METRAGVSTPTIRVLIKTKRGLRGGDAPDSGFLRDLVTLHGGSSWRRRQETRRFSSSLYGTRNETELVVMQRLFFLFFFERTGGGCECAAA